MTLYSMPLQMLMRKRLMQLRIIKRRKKKLTTQKKKRKKHLSMIVHFTTQMVSKKTRTSTLMTDYAFKFRQIKPYHPFIYHKFL